MTSPEHELDLTSNPRWEIADKILIVANLLFDSVKNAPLSLRTSFPNILRNNNFGLAARVTRKYAFLEVTSKFRAQRTREPERLATYRRFLCAEDSGKPVAFAINKSRLGRFSGITVEGSHAISIGSDSSFCVWDSRNILTFADRRITTAVDLLYVVSFGDQIREDECWQEFDALIRVTLADWSTHK